MSKRKLPEGETTEMVARHASRRDAPPAAVRDLAGEKVDPRTRRKTEKDTVEALYDFVQIPLAAGAGSAGAGVAGAPAEAEPLSYPVLNVFLRLAGFGWKVTGFPASATGESGRRELEVFCLW